MITLDLKPEPTILIQQPWITFEVATGLGEALDSAQVERELVGQASNPVVLSVEELLPYGDVVTNEELGNTRAALRDTGSVLAAEFVAEGCNQFVKLPGPPDAQDWLQVSSEERRLSVISMPLEQPYRWLFEVRAGR